MDSIPNLKPDDVFPYVEILSQMQSTGLLERFAVDMDARVRDIQGRVRSVTESWYAAKSQELQGRKDAGVNRALPLLWTTDELEKTAKTLDKRFPDPMFDDRLDLCGLFVEVAVPCFLAELEGSRKRLFESAMNGPTPDVPIQDVFALYRRTRILAEMFEGLVKQCVLRCDRWR